MSTRKATTLLLEMLEDGVLDSDALARACLNYMSEADVADMAQSEGFLDEPEDLDGE